MKILHLTLKKEWFDMILSGEKKEEYREIKPYWKARLAGKEYDAILFRNGYAKNAPRMLVELHWIHQAKGLEKWGAPKEEVFVLRLGKVIHHNGKYL